MKNLQQLPVFIVDDDPFWNAILAQILEGLGFSDIHTFEDGKSCIENLKLNPGLVFLDYQLGASNGLDILKEIKSYNTGIEVVFCTALEDLEVAISAMEYGSTEYLLKAHTTEQSVLQVLQALDNFHTV
ncbi:response regulator [Algoriphagus mannitolivorans]|uniref:response regulator n=1 Tax=Algoriphagus mannitolivorans TaxID=226504 RepID=UPI0004021ED2|nr:response regulator [Algoriphagus mannitolivorans]